MATEGVDGPCTGDPFTRVRNSGWNKMFLPRFYWNANSIDDQRIASLNHSPVLVIVMNLRRGRRGLVADPKRHLASVRPIVNVALHSRSRLATGGNLFVGHFMDAGKSSIVFL